MNLPPSLNALTRDPTRSENFRKVPSWLLPVAIGLGFCLLFFALFGGRLLPAPEVQVAVVLASAGEDSGTSAAPGQLLFQASGWIEAAPFPSKATALVDGVVESVAVLEGQDVLEGQLLATLIDADARLAYAIAEQAHQTLLAERAVHLAAISAAEKRLLAARAQVEVAGTLRDEAADQLARFERIPRNAIPASDLISARLRLSRENSLKRVMEVGGEEQEAEIHRLKLESEVKDSAIRSAALALEQAQLALSRTRILAPFAGRVLRLHAAPGQKKMLADDHPDSSTIAVLYDPAHLQVRVDVPLADAAGLEVGQAARVRCGLFPDQIFQGEVTRIVAEADLQRNTLQAKVRIHAPADRLRPEMLCRVEFLGGARALAGQSAEIATWVPDAALVDGKLWLCDPESKKVLTRQIQVAGETRDGFTRIASGVRPGEWVVLSPQGLSEGQRVNPTRIQP